jgi:hypothetical protein
MATCVVGELITEACASGFTCIAESKDLAQAAELQLLKNISGDTSTFGELIEQACDNNFFCLSKDQYQAATLQLLCNLTGGS